MEEKVLVIFNRDICGENDVEWFVCNKSDNYEEKAVEYVLENHCIETEDEVEIYDCYTVEKKLILEVANSLPVEKIPSLKYKPTA